MDEIRGTIARIIYTINQVDVRGKDNMDKLLGCIQALEGLQERMKAEQDKE